MRHWTFGRERDPGTSSEPKNPCSTGPVRDSFTNREESLGSTPRQWVTPHRRGVLGPEGTPTSTSGGDFSRKMGEWGAGRRPEAIPFAALRPKTGRKGSNFHQARGFPNRNARKLRGVLILTGNSVLRKSVGGGLGIGCSPALRAAFGLVARRTSPGPSELRRRYATYSQDNRPCFPPDRLQVVRKVPRLSTGNAIAARLKRSF